jgi:hypothetical protein
MASPGIDRLLTKALEDESFAQTLRTDLESAMAECKLSEAERELLRSEDPTRVQELGTQLGLDARTIDRLTRRGLGDWSVWAT